MSAQYVIAMGNPADGFEYIGPFTRESASDYADKYLDKANYWLIMLQSPTEEQ